jgi:hypothetical protein
MQPDNSIKLPVIMSIGFWDFYEISSSTSSEKLTLLRKQWDGRSHLSGIEMCQSGGV